MLWWPCDRRTVQLLLQLKCKDSLPQLTAQEQEPFHRPLKQRRARSNLLKAITGTVLDGRYVASTDQCSSSVAGPLQSRPIILLNQLWKLLRAQ